MATAYDKDGNALGPEIIKSTADESLRASMEEHLDAAEYRVRMLRDSIEPTAEEIIKAIDNKMGDGWAANLARCLSD